MSRNMHLVDVTPELQQQLLKARLAAAALVIVAFSAFVAFAPQVDPAHAQPPAVAAAPD
jgi:hypothetical protein